MRFLWPTSFPGIRYSHLFSRTHTHEIEEMVSDYFSGGYPVLLSSVRAGIRLLLVRLGLGRSNCVKVPPYASHCVIESVARLTNPIPYPASVACDASLIYHQWGLVQQSIYHEAGLIIEDACDSFCIPGTEPLFPLDGDFELWSLPKILATGTGAIVWCREELAAIKLRQLRDNLPGSGFTQYFLRMFSRRYPGLNSYWAGSESLGGNLPAVAQREIFEAVVEWPNLAKERSKRLGVSRHLMDEKYNNMLRDDRIPCCLPISTKYDLPVHGKAIGLIVEARAFETINLGGISELSRVYPLPIHQDIDLSELDRLISNLEKK